MKDTEIKACPFCGEPAGVEIKTANGKEYYAIGCKNLTCRGSAWAGDPDAVRALARWNQRAGDREPEAPKPNGGEVVGSKECVRPLRLSVVSVTDSSETYRYRQASEWCAKHVSSEDYKVGIPSKGYTTFHFKKWSDLASFVAAAENDWPNVQAERRPEQPKDNERTAN